MKNRFILITLIFINIISCNDSKNKKDVYSSEINNSVTNNIETNYIIDNTSNDNKNILETNNLYTDDIYDGYASNEDDIYELLTKLNEYELLAIEELESVKDTDSLDAWQSEYTKESPLIFACQYFPTEEKAIELISYGADIDERADYGYTPLMEASSRGYLKLVKELIKNGADVNIMRYEQDDALSCAVLSTNKNSTKIVEELLNAGAVAYRDYPIPDSEDETVTIIDKFFDYSCDAEKFKLLAEAGADIENSYFGIPVIAMAVQKDCIDIVKYLVSKGIDPAMNYTDYRNIEFSLLNETFDNKTTDIAEYLIKNGADVNSQSTMDPYSKETQNLIFTAIEEDNIELVKLLIEYGADTSAVNKEGKTIFDIAKEKGYNEIEQLKK
ncbi:ankyrin repeat domain-containing protein [Brachyspira hyodysenteriae]|uniref:ankyrin repeat domain-containing protein n=1 Tax=Brachyspira hyodysenteriae TaxID=159 RepID=UPI00063DD63E|nr:ankyrin repeat domain-containing protein [Brachyspira hyodysenteriae]AUJ48607.1 ankyrin repeat-containing protein [Brachyspira hyodysenteriae]KLI17592.1 ankryin [Brachyspira hyodysenteriae]KLI35991.1 ankryin [Brachyspira hyodysenteriae]KLI61785.1 ankryin [Brachyspira hyodysenteriae]TVL73141.1 ankryin [Brachyspira hyodysenteriae]